MSNFKSCQFFNCNPLQLTCHTVKISWENHVIIERFIVRFHTPTLETLVLIASYASYIRYILLAKYIRVQLQRVHLRLSREFTRYQSHREMLIWKSGTLIPEFQELFITVKESGQIQTSAIPPPKNHRKTITSFNATPSWDDTTHRTIHQLGTPRQTPP